jgi:tRNA(Ile)-lysidine synthase
VTAADRLLAEVRRTLFTGPEAQQGVLVAISGGPDSVALARALLAARPDSNVPIGWAHLNHRLRGAESDADQAFVRHLFEMLEGVGGLSLVVHEIDTAQLAKSRGNNLEATARQERYRWLTDMARQAGWQRVVTGHTADDQAETVAHRLLRGSGLTGLRGIAARRRLAGGIEVIRPLLQVNRQDALAYLHGLGQSYRLDSSNSDLRFTRNRIRHELLPHLAEAYNPRIGQVLVRLADHASEAWQVEARAGARLLKLAELPRAGPVVVLDANRLAAAAKAHVRVALRRLWRREGWSKGKMGFAHWDRLATLAIALQGACDLPGGIHARRRNHVLQLGPKVRVSHGESAEIRR